MIVYAKGSASVRAGKSEPYVCNNGHLHGRVRARGRVFVDGDFAAKLMRPQPDENGVIWAKARGHVRIRGATKVTVMSEAIGRSVLGHRPLWLDRMISQDPQGVRGPPQYAEVNQFAFNF